ncbi:uncharacterized protein BXZ73DRAFT_543, partial [Epithele typhae]|uniref:uncharacterized protein n=1 Tax=Epithele typhae TaxID=378194 RepID=UPI0020072BC1
ISITDLPNAQRAKHLAENTENSTPFVQSGRVVLAGGVLRDGVVSSQADARQKVKGSLMIASAETAEELWDFIRKDIFWTSREVISFE